MKQNILTNKSHKNANQLKKINFFLSKFCFLFPPQGLKGRKMPLEKETMKTKLFHRTQNHSKNETIFWP